MIVMFIPRPASSLGMKPWNFGYHGNHRPPTVCWQCGDARILGTSDSVGVAMCTLAVGVQAMFSPGALPRGMGYLTCSFGAVLF